MPTCTLDLAVAAPPETTFEVYSDVSQTAERIAGIRRVEVLSEGPVGVGTRWKETREMFGKEASETMEITAFEPPRFYEVAAASHGSAYHTRFEFTPEGEGTHVTMTFSATPQSLSAKVMTTLLRPWLMSTIEKAMGNDMRDLKRAAEAGG